MPFGSVTLEPGVNTEKTPTTLTAGVSSSQLIRYRDSLIQKMGGWTSFIATAVTGIPRDLHAWQDLDTVRHLSYGTIGTVSQLGIVTGSTIVNITPSLFTSNFTPHFSTVSGSGTVTIVDPNLTGSVGDTFRNVFVVFNTPISVGGIILGGGFPTTQGATTGTYTIPSFAANTTVNGTGAVPVFTTINNSVRVVTQFADHRCVTGDSVSFIAPTTGNGITIQGYYPITSVNSSSNFNIHSVVPATASGSFAMNGGLAQLVYQTFTNTTGDATVYQTGSPITPSDWTSDNWGEILLVAAQNGYVYQFQLNGLYASATPVFASGTNNVGGLFISTTQQILVVWGATTRDGSSQPGFVTIGFHNDPLLIIWSDSGDYTNFSPSSATQAGDFRIPTGSRIVAGIATPNQNLIFTDEDCWAMNYLGQPFIFGFNKIGGGAGAISSHCVQQLRGNVYWMGPSNFYALSGSGLSVMPCPVWDFVFQNLNTTYAANVRAMPNTPYNEVGWLFPSNASVSGECDSYVKMNITEPNAPWDYGQSSTLATKLQRSAWIDQSVLGNPISADSNGFIYQQEMGSDAAGSPMTSSFTTGYFFIDEGEDFCFVDQILPDFIWGEFGAAQTATIQLTFNAVNYPGDTPTSYGPYSVTKATQYITVRIRCRQLSITVTSSDMGSFWRLGRVRYRYAPAGRR